MLNLLVTGGAGFIGSHFVEYLLKHYPEYRIINLDKLTYAGSLDNLSDVLNNPKHIFIQGDILDAALLEELFTAYQINAVVHFAAESHVDNSIAKPDAFIQTNIHGTFQLLEMAKKFWYQKATQDHLSLFRFHHISTDEVYGSLGKEGYFFETSPYAPNSPYSASKASSDMLVRSYHKTYQLNTVITNCSNNFGPKQHDEKLIPTIIRNAILNKPIPIYGNGLNVRDWLSVNDHVQAIDWVLHNGIKGEHYNIGGDQELSNLEIAKKICALLDEIRPRADRVSYAEQINFVTDRLGHDFRYAVNTDKIQALGWKPLSQFPEELYQTVCWYLNKYQNN
ncbi:MAG: dTDP-glucose 4,6-dehydratase [Candidatus Berkiella sp.]